MLSADKLESCKKQLLELGLSRMGKAKEEISFADVDIMKRTLSVERISVTDLDGDGTPELFAKYKAELETGSLHAHYTGNDYFGLLGVSLATPSPKVFFEFHDYQSKECWGVGPEFIAAADLDGDRVDEVVMSNSEYESMEFQIYRFTNGGLSIAFEGAVYGC